jgi:hypothetical protein
MHAKLAEALPWAMTRVFPNVTLRYRTRLERVVSAGVLSAGV